MKKRNLKNNSKLRKILTGLYVLTGFSTIYRGGVEILEYKSNKIAKTSDKTRENELGYELPSRYQEFLSYLNGGKFMNIDFFSLVEKEYPNSLYYRNFLTPIKRELRMADHEFIIGKYENYVMYVDCLEADGSYTLMDIRNNEKIEFESLNSLVGFIFYILVINTNKKMEKEKEQIQEMKEKLHKQITAKNKEWKKEKEKNSAKIRAKAAAKGLKEKQKKKLKK